MEVVVPRQNVYLRRQVSPRPLVLHLAEEPPRLPGCRRQRLRQQIPQPPASRVLFTQRPHGARRRPRGLLAGEQQTAAQELQSVLRCTIAAFLAEEDGGVQVLEEGEGGLTVAPEGEAVEDLRHDL